MKRDFAEHLDSYVKQAGLSLRQMSGLSGIPHQTLYNWLRGSQPRWHMDLPDDIRRLGAALDLSEDEIGLLLQLAGCISARSERYLMQEMTMDNKLRMPKGWFAGGDRGITPDGYEIGVDPDCTYRTYPCVTLKGSQEATAFAALVQQVKATAYHGQRLRFRAALSTEDVVGRVALFMRVGGPNGQMLAFDNMRERYISGTQGWQYHNIVLDVDEQAEDITFGVFLSLQGQVWMADVHLEEVHEDVASTDIMPEIASFFPVNLDFTE